MTTESTPYIGIDADGKVVLTAHGIPSMMTEKQWKEYHEGGGDVVTIGALPDRTQMRYDPNTGEYVKV